jgi:hypothetical protein
MSRQNFQFPSEGTVRSIRRTGMVTSLTPMLMLSLSRPRLVTNWKSDVFLNDTYISFGSGSATLLPHCHTVDPHCFGADPDPDPGGGGGGSRSAKNVHPPWQNPRYAPAGLFFLETLNKYWISCETLPLISHCIIFMRTSSCCSTCGHCLTGSPRRLERVLILRKLSLFKGL